MLQFFSKMLQKSFKNASKINQKCEMLEKSIKHAPKMFKKC